MIYQQMGNLWMLVISQYFRSCILPGCPPPYTHTYTHTHTHTHRYTLKHDSWRLALKTLEVVVDLFPGFLKASPSMVKETLQRSERSRQEIDIFVPCHFHCLVIQSLFHRQSITILICKVRNGDYWRETHSQPGVGLFSQKKLCLSNTWFVFVCILILYPMVNTAFF